MGKDTFFCKKKTIRFRGEIKEIEQPWVMGILNITPDSFYDGGKYNSEKEIVLRVQKMLSEGATIIDVGGVSSRPGSDLVSPEEETKRLKPVLKVLAEKFPDTWFSIDTFRSGIAKMAVEEYGFYMINDISSGRLDEKMFDCVEKLNVPYVIMHMKGEPDNMQKSPQYENVTNEIIQYFSGIIKELNGRGVNDIIIDPGFGFGKTLKHNYQLLKELDLFEMLDQPVLVGVSRKAMIQKLIDCTPEESLNGTSVVNALALINGADILRVHDVKQAVEAIKITSYYKTS